MINKLVCLKCETVFEFERISTVPLPTLCNKCRAEKPVARIVTTCANCDKEFVYHTHVGKPPRFCSPLCRITSLKSYQKQYYKKRRAEEPAITVKDQINRIKGKPCLRCGNEGHVAQIINNIEDAGNIIPLCHDCSFSLFSQKWDISEIEDKLEEQYPDQYVWLQIKKYS